MLQKLSVGIPFFNEIEFLAELYTRVSECAGACVQAGLDDGRKYDIDEVKDKCRAASLKAGGCGIRYTIRIGVRDTYLFDEDGRWFVEMRAG
jgi:hypothetical protein